LVLKGLKTRYEQGSRWEQKENQGRRDVATAEISGMSIAGDGGVTLLGFDASGRTKFGQ
jgi:hypothetical protein